MIGQDPQPGRARAVDSAALVRRLMYDDLAFFMAQLVGGDGRRLQVAAHHEKWCRLAMEHARFVLLAPRDHSKTTVALVFVLWMFFRHSTDPSTGRPHVAPRGTYLAVLFSATQAQAGVHMARFRDLLAANAWLFLSAAGLRPAGSKAVASSNTHVRLPCGAELRTRAYHMSVRGMHPDLLLLDDVLSDRNSGSAHQRTET